MTITSSTSLALPLSLNSLNSNTTTTTTITGTTATRTSTSTSAFSGMKVLSKKDDDDMFMGSGGKNKGGGKNNKNSKNNSSNNNDTTMSNNSNNNSNSNSSNNNKSDNILSRSNDTIHNYTECSAYCHVNKRVGDTVESTEQEKEKGEGGGGEGDRTRAYWLCQLSLTSVCLVSDQKVPVQDNVGPSKEALADIAHTSLLPVMSYLTSLAYGKIKIILLSFNSMNCFVGA